MDVLKTLDDFGALYPLFLDWALMPAIMTALVCLLYMSHYAERRDEVENEVNRLKYDLCAKTVRGVFLLPFFVLFLCVLRDAKGASLVSALVFIMIGVIHRGRVGALELEFRKKQEATQAEEGAKK